RVSGRPRRAGVNSLGVGGTNAHVVVEEAPVRAASGPSRAAQVLVLSARTAAALEAATDRLRAHLVADPTITLADVAYTLQVGRRGLEHRRMLVCRDRDDAIARLTTPDAAHGVETAAQKPIARRVARGVGESGRPGGGDEVAAAEADYRTAVDHCRRLLGGDDVELPAVRAFITQWGLVQLWRAWGITPAVAVGIGAGEYGAACLAGVLSLEDALALVA